MSQPQPNHNENRVTGDSPNAVYVECDGPADTTIRPVGAALRTILEARRKQLESRRPPDEPQPPAADKPS